MNELVKIQRNNVFTSGKIISFKPFDVVLDIILQDVEGYIESLLDIGEPETANEWIEIVKGIKQNGISAYEADIRGYITDMFYAVCGMPHRYLDKSGVEFFNAVCEYYDPSEETE